ncbi:MAG TPA: phytanoyl-CoA dioxygenase family protein [Caulobacteraceae bacterium]|nr:phytanoyl-CoA dioxygenase family protein [Caulobacteraceae bacterium]
MNAPAAPRAHPRNQGFAWREARPEAGLRRVTPAQKRQFDEQGFFVLQDAFTPEELAAVEAAIDPLEQEHERRVRAKEGNSRLSRADAITFTVHIVGKSPVLRAFAAHPALADLCHDLIGDDVRLYWDQSVYKKSGVPQEFPWHQDNGYTFVEPQQYLTVWIPLVDVDIENGCPWIAPGLHKLGTLEHWPTPIGFKCLEEAPGAVAAPARRGDAIVFSSLAPHRTGPNLKAGTVRKAYILQYAPVGAQAVKPDGSRLAQDDPDRQFPILVGGEAP